MNLKSNGVILWKDICQLDIDSYVTSNEYYEEEVYKVYCLTTNHSLIIYGGRFEIRRFCPMYHVWCEECFKIEFQLKIN